jgi:hypothetical protein
MRKLFTTIGVADALIAGPAAMAQTGSGSPDRRVRQINRNRLAKLRSATVSRAPQTCLRKKT